MKHKFRVFVIIILFVMITVAFTSSYSRVTIDNAAVVVALGVDLDTDSNSVDSSQGNKMQNISPQKKLKVSFQFIKAAAASESGSSGEASSFVKTVSASSISSAINLMNTHIGKELSLSHCKLIVFSEELAAQGISDEIYTLTNNTQVRPTTNIVVSKCSAKSYIENSKPLLESLVSKYYELFVSSSKFTGYTVNATLGDFFDKMICNSCQPYAILGGMNLQLSDDVNQITTSTIGSSDKSNSSSLDSDSKTSENIGMAAFKDCQLVGELNAIETLSFMCINNQIEGFLVTIPNPDSDNSYVDIYLTPTKDTKIEVSLVNGSPYIKINCQFSGQIHSMEKNADYLDDTALIGLSTSCKRYLEYVFTEYMYRTSKEFKSDINSVGKYATKLFLTTEQFDDYNWANAYPDSFFEVDTSVNIKSASLLSNT